MHRFITAAITTTIAVLVPAATAAADRAECSKPLEAHYSAHWHAVRDAGKAGKLPEGAQGRNIRAQGMRYRAHGGYRVRDARCGELRKSLAQLRALRSPTPPPGAPLLTRTTGGGQPPAGVASAGVAANLPGCADESHGNYSTGPENTNPSSGATGRWQTLRSHYAAGGVCAGLDLSPAGQDTCAARIYAEQGAGAWVGC